MGFNSAFKGLMQRGRTLLIFILTLIIPMSFWTNKCESNSV